MRMIFIILILTFIFCSCATKLPYATDYPLTNQYFQSRDDIFSGKIPDGWFSSTDDTLGKSLVVWLLKEDFTATLTVRELLLDRLSIQRVQKEGLETLAYISAGLQFSDVKNPKLEPFKFKLNDKKFCSYELTLEAERKRIVVFAIKGKYYECESYPLKGEWSAADLTRLFTIQQTVLASIRL